MGRSKELSDFQRGTVVGCHRGKKSVREISDLLQLPRSTVSCVIRNWKHAGITTVLPRCGRPQMLREEHRRLLEMLVLEKGFRSVEDLTAEFQNISGATVSSKTIRRELHEMGFRGRLSAYCPKAGVGRKVEKKQQRSRPAEAPVDVSHLDLRVGHVVSAQLLPETDGVYVLQVDVGESSRRTVVSELTQNTPVEQLQNRMAVLLCNVKPAEVSGVASQAVVMCARSPDKVEILDPPSGAVPGDRVTVQGFTGEPDKELNLKNVWEQIRPDLRTDGQCVATYKGAALEVGDRGVCKSLTTSDCEIK